MKAIELANKFVKVNTLFGGEHIYCGIYEDFFRDNYFLTWLKENRPAAYSLCKEVLETDLEDLETIDFLDEMADYQPDSKTRKAFGTKTVGTLQPGDEFSASIMEAMNNLAEYGDDELDNTCSPSLTYAFFLYALYLVNEKPAIVKKLSKDETFVEVEDEYDYTKEPYSYLNWA